MVSRRTCLTGMLFGFGLAKVSGAVTPARAETEPSRTIERAGARLYVETEGAGQPVLLLHGGLGHMGWFASLREHLSRTGWRVVLIDTRGMGRSSLGSTALSYGVVEQDVVAVLDTLGIERCSVIGFSDGGIVGYRLASAANPRVDRLVTIGSRWSAANGQTMWPVFDTWTRAALEAGDFRFIVDDYDRLNPDREFDRMIDQAKAMWKDAGPNGHPEGAIAGIDSPVLAVVGDRDPFLSVPDAFAAKSQMKNAELLVLPGAGHDAYRQRSGLFNLAVDRFLGAAG